MLLLDVIREGGIPTFVLLLIGLFALITGLVAGVLLAMKKKVPPALVLVPLSGAALISVMTYQAAAGSIASTLAVAPSEMKMTLMASLLAMSSSALLVASVVMMLVPIPVVWIGMIIGFRQEKRSWGVALFWAALLIVGALTPFLGLAYDASIPYMAVRALVAASLVLPVSVMLLATDEPGRMAGLTGTGLAAMSVIGGVAFEAAMGSRDAMMALAYAPADAKSRQLADGLEYVQSIATLGWIPIVAVLFLMVVAAVRVKQGGGRLGVTVGMAAAVLATATVWVDVAGLMGRVWQ